jgi:hypothetical protein
MCALVLRTDTVTKNNFSRLIFGNEMRIVFVELMNDIKILPNTISVLKAKTVNEGKPYVKHEI